MDSDTNINLNDKKDGNISLLGKKGRKFFISNDNNNIRNRVKEMKIDKKTFEKYDNKLSFLFFIFFE
jgi:hypothetical protein